MNRKEIKDWTDKYFTRTADIVSAEGEKEVIYATFIRRPCLMACDLAMDWIAQVADQDGFQVEIIPAAESGAEIGAGDPLFFVKGPMSQLSELETIWLQKTGVPCVTAMNARDVSLALPQVPFSAQDARHCAGLEMAEMAAYGVSVGSLAARHQGAKGFMSNATDATAHFFDQDKGAGTMPHALIGYAGSTLRAAEMFVEHHPDASLVVLVDYFGKEVTDALQVCEQMSDKVEAGQMAFRLDTHGGRYIEGLDPQSSYAVLERHIPDVVRQYRTEAEQKHMIGTGVSAAAVWHFREKLDSAGFEKARIICSSGFSPAKCRVFAQAKAPVDAIGTGSTLPQNWSESYATADIISYGGEYSAKQGREYLIEAYKRLLAV